DRAHEADQERARPAGPAQPGEGTLMGRIIAWIILIFVVLFAIRMIGVRNERARRRAEQAANGPPAEAMVRCARCGGDLPRQDARAVAGGSACAGGPCAART